jgi:mono/diheme cytochrome c family protein
MIHAQSTFVRCAAGLLLAACGCGPNPQAQFAWRDGTLGLLPEAKKAVQKTITDDFGTPHEIVAWDRLPVNFGGVRGTVAAPAEGVTLATGQLSVQFAGPVDGVKAEDPVAWLSGPLAAEKNPTDTVKSFDPATGVLQLTSFSGEAPAGAQLAIGFGKTMQLGRVAYMKNCNHCHGVAGDGQGPTAQYLNPKPRDYRLGLFKFTSTTSMSKATKHDLETIIRQGIPGTYMPSFLLMKDDEVAAIIEYIRWLAMRGELEKRLVDELADYTTANIEDSYKKADEAYQDDKQANEKPSRSAMTKKLNEELKQYLAEDYAGAVSDTADMIADLWKQAEDPTNVIVPTVGRVPDTPESRARGRLLYLSDKAKCYTCHGPTGRGDGAATEDFWPKPGSTEKYEKRGLHDFWGQALPPRDLTKGQYRGGRRPIDIFRRVHAGIKGTPMPAFGVTVLKDQDIWDVVNYVMSIPFESQPSPSAKPAAAMAQTEHK